MKLLYDVLREGAVVCPLRETEKWKAIEEGVRALPQAASGLVPVEEGMKAIRDRELKEQQTILEHGLAIPHGILPDPKPLVCCLCISPSGIVYNEKGDMANIIFILLGSISVRKDYLGTLAHIARLFREESLRDKVLGASGPEQVLQFIQEAERL